MKAVWIVLSLLLLGAMSISALAQDENQEVTCTAAEWAEFVPDLIGILNSISTSDDPLADIFLVDAWLDTTRTICTGGVWTSEEYGMEGSIIGPVVFGGTLYEATAKTEGTILITSVEVEGDCDIIFISLNVEEGQQENETKDLLQFDGCVAYFEVKGYGDPWSLSLVRVK